MQVHVTVSSWCWSILWGEHGDGVDSSNLGRAGPTRNILTVAGTKCATFSGWSIIELSLLG